jgi:preprotein translocase subunit YajC
MNGILPPTLPHGLVLLSGLGPHPQEEPIGGAPQAAPSQPAPAPAGEGKAATKEEGGGQGQPQKGPYDACPQMLLMVGVMVAFFWFFLIRPQQKQEKKRKEMLATLAKNDKVITSSGIHGTVAALDERTVVLKIDEKGDVRVKFDRSAVASILNRPGHEGGPAK